MKKRKPRVVWIIEDCKWGTLRTMHTTYREAERAKFCSSCKVVKFIEADKERGGG